jgi:hypothetical protein
MTSASTIPLILKRIKRYSKAPERAVRNTAPKTARRYGSPNEFRKAQQKSPDKI